MTEPITVCPFDQLAPDSVTRFEVADRILSVIRLADEVFVIGDQCSHANVSLSEGEIDVDDRTIECPQHGALFSIETGEPETLPATKPVPTYLSLIHI